MAIQFVNNVGFNLNQAESIVIEKLGTDPTSDLVVGRIIFNTASDTLKQYVSDTGAGSPGWVDVGGGVTDITAASGTYISFTDASAATGSVDLGTFDLSAVDGTSTTATRFLSKDNTWDVPSYTTITTTDGAYIDLTPNTATGGDVTITADISAVDGTAAANERYLTKNNTWAEIATIPGTYTWTLDGNNGTSQTINSGDTVTFLGGTNITTEVNDPAGDNLTINLDDSITLAGTLTVNGTGQSSFGGQVTVPATPSANTDAASKQYVLSQVGGVGGFQGGYNANLNTPALTGASNVALNQGDFYVVTTAGTFFTENVEVGDFIFANSNIAANSSPSLSDYTVVIADQNVAGEGATDGATQKGVAGFNSAHFNVTANGFVSSDIYAGGSALGIVPSGGAGTTFLRGDGAWAVPADTGALGDRVSLTGGVQAGGLTTFTYDVTNSFGAGTVALDVKCEVISSAGETVYASVTRSGANLIVEFTGSISNGAYEVLLTYVG